MIYGFTNALVGSGGSASVEQNGQLLMDFNPLTCLAQNGSAGAVSSASEIQTPNNNTEE